MGFFARLGFLRETADFLKIFVKTIQLQEDLIILFLRKATICNRLPIKKQTLLKNTLKIRIVCLSSDCR